MSDKQKKIVSAVSLTLFVLFFLFVTVFLGKALIRLVKKPESFRVWAEERGFLGKIIFVGMMAMQVVVALIPGEPLEICAGVAFGAWEGTLLCLIGILIGSLCIYGLVKLLGIRLLEVFFPVEKIRSLRWIQDSKKRDILLFAVMMIPGTPKDLISYFAPLTGISMGQWLLLCTFARIPSLVTSTFPGNALGEGRYLSALVLFLITGAISILGAWFFNRHLSARKNK